jgi:outer membrane protein OmpA-like peptidoglycan-associated protein
MRLFAALLIPLVAAVGGAVVLWPDAMSMLGSVTQNEGIEDPKPERSTAIRRPDPTGDGPTDDARGPFDVATIAPDGTSVFAGKSTPHSAVTVFADGEVVGTANTDQNGEWVLIVDRKFANADPKLSVQVGPKSPAQRPSPVLADAPSAPASSPSAQLMDALQRRVEEARAEGQRVAAAKSGTMTDGEPQNKSEETRPLATTVSPTSTGSPAASPTIVPVPIKFVFRTAEFTDEGKKAADLLLQYLLLRQLPSIRMTGHADERGTSAFNMSLSSERLEAVAAFLRAGGYTGRVELIPK